MGKDAHQTQSFPRIRHATVDLLAAASRKHMIHSLVEMDVEDTRRRLRRLGMQEQTGQKPSFTGFILGCCARAVQQDPQVHAYRDLRNRLVMFDDVDVSTTVERVVNGAPQVVPTLIRAANRKTLWDISAEIRQAQSEPVADAGVYRSMMLYLSVPPFVRRLVFRALDRAPSLMKQRAGTVMVTSVGMFGGGAGWGVPVASHTLNLTVGGIVPRVRVIDGKAVERAHLCLTVSFDHDIVDGAPAARFLQRLRPLIEEGTDLLEEAEQRVGLSTE